MRKLIDNFRYYSDKRFSTIAGTLVYFLLMSIAPFILWVTLLLGSINLDRLLSFELFQGISPLLSYLKINAESAANSAGIILLVTSLYSSANFFYHLRRSGEIIYGSRKVKGGIKLRLISIVYIILTIVLIALLAGVWFAASYLLKYILPEILTLIIAVIYGTGLAFLIALILNLLACPYRLKASEAVTGSLLTTALWMACVLGFAVYLNFASPEKLYGALAFIVLFLLWCYLMMCCFVVGMINNGYYKTERVYKKHL